MIISNIKNLILRNKCEFVLFIKYIIVYNVYRHVKLYFN